SDLGPVRPSRHAASHDPASIHHPHRGHMMGRLSFSLHRATRVLRDTSGQFALMTAIIAPVAITLAAFAVDAGSLYVEKRQAQALVDLAAITAAANLGK